MPVRGADSRILRKTVRRRGGQPIFLTITKGTARLFDFNSQKQKNNHFLSPFSSGKGKFIPKTLQASEREKVPVHLLEKKTGKPRCPLQPISPEKKNTDTRKVLVVNPTVGSILPLGGSVVRNGTVTAPLRLGTSGEKEKGRRKKSGGNGRTRRDDSGHFEPNMV